MPSVGVKIALVDRAEGVGLLVVVLFGLVKFPPLLVLFAVVMAGGAALLAMVTRISHFLTCTFLNDPHPVGSVSGPGEGVLVRIHCHIQLVPLDGCAGILDIPYPDTLNIEGRSEGENVGISCHRDACLYRGAACSDPVAGAADMLVLLRAVRRAAELSGVPEMNRTFCAGLLGCCKLGFQLLDLFLCFEGFRFPVDCPAAVNVPLSGQVVNPGGCCIGADDAGSGQNDRCGCCQAVPLLPGTARNCESAELGQ